MNSKRLLVVMLCVSIKIFSQVSEDWVMNSLRDHSSTSYEIVNQFNINSPNMSHGGRSINCGMTHLKYCDLSSKEKFLATIATNVHETLHSLDSQIPFMFANEGKIQFGKNDFEGFYINEHLQYTYEFPTNKLFQSRILAAAIPEKLRTFRYKTYIESSTNFQSTQSNGVIGLLDEFNAYYHGSKVVFDLLPLYQEVKGNNFLWLWSSDFSANADAFYEFDFFIKEYLLYARSNYPALYEELKNDQDFKLIYQTIRKRFEELISNYEKKFDSYNTIAKKSNEWIYSSEKHSSLIYPVLSSHINSTRYAIIQQDFLTK